MVIAAAVGAGSHADDPSGLGHLIVDFAQGWSHLVRQSSGDNDHVGLTRRCSEDDAVSVHVVSRGGDVHHLDGTAGEAERQWPQRTFAAPIQDVVETGDGPVGPIRLFPKNHFRLK